MNKFFYILGFILLLFACANPVAPSGGDKDIEAPKIIEAMPASGSANYQGDVIEILFDEYFTILSGEQNVLITPSMPEKPKFIVKGKTLMIKLPESLDPELTYSISLIDAIKDFNEGNVLKTLKYVFTTGPAIDSASVSGKVVEAEYNEAISDVFVGLYKLTDTAILTKTKPTYIARTNEQGSFTIDYVKEGDYIVAAVNDKNFNYVFDQISEEVSMPSIPLKVNGKISLEEEIRVFTNEKPTKTEGYKQLNNNKLFFYFNQELEELNLDILPYNDNNLAYMNDGNDTLFYHWTEDDVDQINFFFSLDSQDPDTVNVALREMDTSDKFMVNAELALNETLKVLCPKPIRQVYSDRVLILDSLNKGIEHQMFYDKEELSIEFKKVATAKYLLQIDSGAIEYYDGTWCDARFMKFIDVLPELPENNLFLSFKNPAPQNAYLELLNKDRRKLASYDVSNKRKLTIEDLNPGVYYIKIYDDQNRNGKWTTGNFELERNPEKIYVLSQAIEIKSNWDKELSLNF